MDNLPTYDVLQSHIRPSPGKDIVGNEYEEDIQIVVGTEIQGGCHIGRRTWLNNVVVYANARIGRYCSFARGASIAAPSHPVAGVSTAVIFPAISASMTFVSTEIGHDVWIGTNATVLAGVKVGHGAVIGANAVVTRDVRPYAIVVGSPAKEMRRRFPDDVCDALVDSRWWDLPHDVLTALPMADVPRALRAIYDLRAQSEATEENERLGRWLVKQRPDADTIAERELDLATRLAEANERAEAAKAVIGALAASVRGLNRNAFQERVRQLGRDTPSEGPQAARHAVLLAEARRVLGIEE